MSKINKDSKHFFILGVLCNMLKYSDFCEDDMETDDQKHSHQELMLICDIILNATEKNLKSSDMPFDEACGIVDVKVDATAKKIKEGILYLLNKASREFCLLVRSTYFREHLLNTGHVTMKYQLVNQISTLINIQHA